MHFELKIGVGEHGANKRIFLMCEKLLRPVFFLNKIMICKNYAFNICKSNI